MTLANRTGWRDHVFGLALAATHLVVLLVTSYGLGMSRDEGFYVTAADRYAGWFEELLRDPASAWTAEAIDEYWEYNHEHPGLMKTLSALSSLAQKKWHWLPYDSMAYRLPGMLTAALLGWLLYIFGAQAQSRCAGVFAALAFGLLPRVFYHAHLNAFDVPIVLMITWTMYCYWRSLESRRWAVLTGVAFGCALATKHNAWVVPGILLIHWMLVRLAAWRREVAWTDGHASRLPWWLVGMVVLGPPTFLGTWPWLWTDTLARFEWYAGFHLHHVYYNIAYFGVNWFQPPFPISYPWVMTVITVPSTTLVLVLLGVFAMRREAMRWPWRGAADPRLTRTLWLGALLAPILIISLPSTPIFGGTKHWFPAYPFLALFAADGFDAVTRVLAAWMERARVWQRGAVVVGSGSLLLAPAVVETVHSHRFGLSHYTMPAGFAPGAADLGMNRQFWGFTTGSLVDYFKTQMPDGGSVWICDTVPQAWDVLQRDGILPRNIRVSWDLASADYAIVHHEHHFVEVDFQIWEAFGTTQPVHVLTYDGVPIISVYENPRRARMHGVHAGEGENP